MIIDLADPLPNRFTLMLRGRAFGPNAGKPVLVRAGDQAQTLTFSETSEERYVSFDLDDVRQHRIEIVPPSPTSPKDIGMSDDQRRLGIGLEGISVVPLTEPPQTRLVR